MMMMMGEMWAKPGSLVAGAMFLWVMFSAMHASSEYSENRYRRSEAYVAIENYLSVDASTRAKRLKADVIKDSQSLTFSFAPAADEKRYYKLTFHKNHREMIVGSYLNHVMKEGKAIEVRNRQRKLFTNNSRDTWYGYKKAVWSHVAFEHPARFETLAMEPKKKEEIINDLTIFRTGKSTMIAAMANLLDYDLYDLELTSVKDNTELRKLLIDTRSKSIIVIEDIDCSLDLTGQRKKKKEKEEDEESKDNSITKKGKEDESKVTLSGLLNVIDGLWSTCGEERLIVFTTNYVEKLDPALIRRGRMDKHIELSYCCFDAFKCWLRITWILTPTIGEARVKAEKEAKEKEEEEKRVKAEKEAKEKEATAGEVKEKEMSDERVTENGVAAVKENGVVF
ncbi:AAA-ATPase ASD, mitochondrial [Vitis vinifera]|uniref:AAA-ATPase ASD, mitochondrial n=1 Tax=Vitis vinifera TaxID=29760 RepID=A0A438EFI5_VITVI|nr:AAA-ATPase ASD, mitochondrial [Vitis vinifera]